MKDWLSCRIAHALLFTLLASGSFASAQDGEPQPAAYTVPLPFAIAQQPLPPVGAAPPLEAAPVEAVPAPATQAPTGPVRLPALGTPRSLGALPVPNQASRNREQQFIERVVDPETTLDLILHRHRLVVLKEIPRRVQIADDKIAGFGLVTERELSLVGREVGTTVLNLWFDNALRPGEQEILSVLVRVLPDPEAKERLDRVYQALEAEINRVFPNSVVRLSLAGDKLVVHGEARDIDEATQILRVLRANAPGEPPQNIPVENLNIIATSDQLGSETAAGLDGETVLTPGLQSFLVAGGPNVINRMRVPGEHQVSLKVTVAEVNRSALRSIGSEVRIGDVSASFFSLFPNLGTVGGNILINDGDFNLALNALRQLNLARSLAEPNLVTLNGRPARFLAGGSFPVPQITGFTGAGLQGVQFVPFGVQLTFTPIVTDRNRIRLMVQAEVSTRDDSVQTTNIGGSNVPSLTQRTFRTQVELRHGQSLAVAGLLQNNFGSNSQRVPFLGDVPLIGRLFANDSTSYDEQELVVVVTPTLVHPLNEMLPLPGSDVFDPSDLEFYLQGHLEGTRGYDYRSTVNTWYNQYRGFRQAQQRCIVGPSGHSDGKY